MVSYGRTTKYLQQNILGFILNVFPQLTDTSFRQTAPTHAKKVGEPEGFSLPTELALLTRGRGSKMEFEWAKRKKSFKGVSWSL